MSNIEKLTLYKQQMEAEGRQKGYIYRKIACPVCQSQNIALIRKDQQSPHLDKMIGYRRRYECLNGHRWTTKESLLLEVEIVVIKKDGRKEPYFEEKYVNSLRKAIADRPINEDRLARIGKELTFMIEDRASAKIYQIKSEDIFRWALNTLKSLDKVSYIRYLSVGSRFSSLTDYKIAIQRLEDEI